MNQPRATCASCGRFIQESASPGPSYWLHSDGQNYDHPATPRSPDDRHRKLNELADRLANKNLYGAQAQLADRDEAVRELRHLAELETDYADLKEQVEQLTPLLDQNRTMHQEVEKYRDQVAKLEAKLKLLKEGLAAVLHIMDGNPQLIL